MPTVVGDLSAAWAIAAGQQQTREGASTSTVTRIQYINAGKASGGG